MSEDSPMDDDIKMVDLHDTQIVQVEITRTSDRLYVNVDGVCRLRIYRPGKIIVVDDRSPNERKMDHVRRT